MEFINQRWDAFKKRRQKYKERRKIRLVICFIPESILLINLMNLKIVHAGFNLYD